MRVFLRKDKKYDKKGEHGQTERERERDGRRKIGMRY